MKKKKEKKHQADEALWVVTSVPEFSISLNVYPRRRASEDRK